jgi:hypothetical protein
MALTAITSAEAVADAMAEYDAIGSAAFLEKYGFGPARRFWLVHEGRRYDSKAIAGAAYGYQHPTQGSLRARDFSGGETTVARQLRRLGFEVVDAADEPLPLPPLDVGRLYTWSDLAGAFGFKTSYLSAVGGMLSRPAHGALLLITHPGGGRSFDYEDYWDGTELVYTGRGKSGDQVLEGANRDVADNRRHLLVFENTGPRQLRYVGKAVCRAHWPARGLGDDGLERTIYRFRLSFGDAVAPPAVPSSRKATRSPAHRIPRPFDPSQPPVARASSGAGTSPEEILALQEKARQGHHLILACLHAALGGWGWREIEEVPAALDLRGTAPDGRRVIFEAKTVTAANEVAQCRTGLAQLIEYRFFYGSPSDHLCLVVDRPLTDARLRLLEWAGVGVALARDGLVQGLGALGDQTLGQG